MENIVYSFEGKTIAQLRAQYQTLLSPATTEVCTETGKVWEIDRQNDHSEQFISQFADYLLTETQNVVSEVQTWVMKAPKSAKIKGDAARIWATVSEKLKITCYIDANFLGWVLGFGDYWDETERIEQSEATHANFFNQNLNFFHQLLAEN